VSVVAANCPSVGAIPVLVRLMGPTSSPLLQKFAAGSVMEIADNEDAGDELIDEGGIELLVHHLCFESGTQVRLA
jgi:hypothetical protein